MIPSVGFQFRLAPTWVQIPREGDVEQWALDTAARVRAERADQPDDVARADDPDWLPREVLASQLLLLAHQVRRTAPELAFALLPLEEPGPVLVAEVLVGDLPDSLTDDEVLAQVLVPDDECPDEPEISSMLTQAGPATEVRQRWAVDPERRMADTTTYLWQVPDQQALVVAQAVSFDLAVADRSQAALDALARGFTLVPA